MNDGKKKKRSGKLLSLTFMYCGAFFKVLDWFNTQSGFIIDKLLKHGMLKQMNENTVECVYVYISERSGCGDTIAKDGFVIPVQIQSRLAQFPFEWNSPCIHLEDFKSI